MRIALTGNPNSGKTTMYNALTGRNEKVGNWAGVTVEKKEFPIKKSYYAGEEQLIAVDLPGAYSMSPFTSEESITSSYVKKENPDVIIVAQPTRGVDIGSIESIRNFIGSATDSGAGVLLISADLDEILSLADRIIVLYEGRITGEIVNDGNVDEMELGLMMTGGKSVE